MKIEKGHATPDGTALEALLELAVKEPGRRPGFYRRLMDSHILALVPHDAVVTNAQGDEVVRFVQWRRTDGLMAIPFFTSARTLFESVPEGAPCLQLDGLTFFLLTRGALLHLNPLSHFNVEIAPQEVQALLEGGSVLQPERLTLSTSKTLSVRDVSDPPLAMMEALTVLYCQATNVKAAYLAQISGMYDAGQESLLLGIEVEGDPAPVVNDSSAVIRDTYQGPFHIDMMQVTPSESTPPWFQPSQRFFERRMAALLVAPVRPGHA